LGLVTGIRRVGGVVYTKEKNTKNDDKYEIVGISRLVLYNYIHG
jgi:hypothetical protein